MTKNYEAKDIQVLEGLDAVRLRPGMYIGTTGSKGLHHILWEIVDNAVDEAANGFASQIDIVLYPDSSVSVTDNGRGIPVDIHPQLKVSGVEVVFTQLHAGGKFNNENYTYSGGLHGVGASVTNALSEWLEVEVVKENILYTQKFHSYSDGDGRVHSGVPATALTSQPAPKNAINGTRITFLADQTVFGQINFSLDTIKKRIKELAFLNKGIQFSVCDKRASLTPQDDYSVNYKYDGGIVDFVRYLNENKNPTHEDVIYLNGKNSVLNFECAIQYNATYTESVFSYVNNIPTAEGGTHETGFKSAYTKAFNDYARKASLLKEKEENLLGDDFREGITAVLNIKMSNVQFEGQTKTKLGNPEARTAVEAIMSDAIAQFLNDDKGVLSDQIVKRAIAAAKVREAARKAKEITRAKNSMDNANLVGKLASCTGRNSKQNELFIVEGDSAGGSAKQARDRKFQAILPLRGKPLNSERKRLDQVLANEEIRTIISALNTSIGEDFDIESLRYDKIIILADADQDGAHIRSILLTFFFRYMRELLKEGHIYIGMPPLYKVFKKDQIIYAYDDSELKEAIGRIGRNYTLQRYKGLGEMNPEQLWETTMNPQSRTLMRVTLEDAAEAEHIVTTLMGDSAEARKAYIAEHANFNKEKDQILDEYGK